MFSLGYLKEWGSIESTFIADARFLSDHWPHPQWQPLWYLGTRFDYVYPPALRYGTAALARWFSMEPVRAYHLYVAFFYCLGIAGVYALVRAGSRSRGAAWLAAMASALVSPSFLLLAQFRYDARRYEPQRLHVLIQYGEGPHMTSLAVLGFALALSYVALRTGRRTAIAGAAVCSALVPLNNFYGATALAVFFPVLVWAAWIAEPDRRIWVRAALIAVPAWALTAFWLTPSYLRVTLENLKLVSGPGNAWSVAAAAVVAAAFAAATWKLAAGRKERAYAVFVWGSLLFFSLNVIGHFWFGFRIAGEPHRLVPELDLVMILAAAEAVRWLWARRQRAARVAVVIVIAWALFTARRYVRHAWELFPEDPNWRDRIEYRLADWMASNMPGSRAVVTGSTRFWYDAWHDLPQLGGGSEQGLTNPKVVNAMWELILGPDPEPGALWIRAFAIDAVIVNDKRSQDVYRDFVYPAKFAGVLPVAYDSGRGDVIYRVPRRYAGLARLVDRARARALEPVRHNYDVERLRPYVAVIEDGSAASAEWLGTAELRVRTDAAPGQALLAHVSFDPAWHAYSGRQALPVHPDVLNQMLIDVPAGRHEIRLVFETPLEKKAGCAITLAALLLLAGMVVQDLARRKPV